MRLTGAVVIALVLPSIDFISPQESQELSMAQPSPDVHLYELDSDIAVTNLNPEAVANQRPTV